MGTQTAATPAGSAGTPAGPMASFLNAAPIAFFIAIIYMFLIRPQQRQEKERRKMVDALKVGDKILTQGGVYGVVASLKGENILVRLNEGKMEISRSAVTRVFTESSNGAAAAPSGERVS